MGNRIATLAFLIPFVFALGLLIWKQSKFSTSTGEKIESSVAVDFVEKKSTIASNSGNVIGLSSVIDGDTVDVDGNRIRLNGIDAPESSQTCNMAGETYRCGLHAEEFLRQIIGSGQLDCKPLTKDRYGRIVATCWLDGRDLGMTMVANGWALAYRQYDMVYVAQENEAYKAGLGMWAGAFVEPWLWRKGQRLEGE